MKSRHGIDKISRFMAVLIFSTCVITACSNDSESDNGNNQPPQLSLTLQSSAPLGQPTNIAADRYIKNGLYVIGTQGLVDSNDGGTDGAVAHPTPEFSSTNTQVSGVDEADRIEYDGEYLYVANLPSWDSQSGIENSVSVFKRDVDFALQSIANIPLESDVEISGMYLHENSLGVITRVFGFYPLEDALIVSSPWQNPDNDTRIDIIDVSTPETPAKTHQVSVDGGLISSRRIGNDLYLALQYVPYVEGLPSVNSSNSSLVNYYRYLLQLDNDVLAPQITINAQTLPLYDINDCLLPENAGPQNGHIQMVSVVKIDMTSPTSYSALCMVVEARGLYMSSDNLYLHAQQNRDTVFHKISLQDDIAYQASGKVNGMFGWRSAPQFKMAEKEGHLMAVTSEGIWEDDPEHYLHVLQQQGSELIEVATLPNSNEPAPIGKPGEDIYAVRFYEDKAYVVTFERIDPLYVIDLSSVDAPVIKGELNIPGFSSYLHPMENGLLLGVGQQVNVENIPLPGEQPSTTPIEEGMKVSLFDVLDPENPILLDEYVWADSYTPAEYDHRALSVLKTEQGYRFAVPSESWTTIDEAWTLQYSLHMLEVNSDTRTLSLVDSVEKAPEEENYYGSYDDRSVLHDDHVYYIRGNIVFHTLWEEGAPVTGPF